MSAKTVSFISEKGGVGKTTCVYHIGIGLVRWHNKRVLFLDADYQRGGLTVRLEPKLLEEFKKGSMPGTTLFHTFQALYSAQSSLPQPDVHSTTLGIPLIPSDPRLTGVAVEKLPSSSNIRANTANLFKHLSVIEDVLNPYRSQYDYILIDTHPETSELLRTAVFASNYCVSPVKLDEQSSVGVPSAIEAINGVNSDVKAFAATIDVARKHVPAQYVGAVGMMAREYGKRLKRTERSQYRRLQSAGDIFESYVTEGDGLRKAAELRVPVFDIEGGNAQKQTAQYREVVEEFLQRCP